MSDTGVQGEVQRVAVVTGAASGIGKATAELFAERGFNVVAVVLGFVGLNQVKKTGQRGRGLALAAVIIGLISVVILVIVVIGGIVATANGVVVN